MKISTRRGRGHRNAATHRNRSVVAVLSLVLIRLSKDVLKSRRSMVISGRRRHAGGLKGRSGLPIIVLCYLPAKPEWFLSYRESLSRF